MSVYCELSKKGDRIELFWTGTTTSSQRVEYVNKAKTIHGAAFHKKNNRAYPGNAYWNAPLDIETARDLRRKYGDDLELGPRIIAWGKRVVSDEGKLRTLASAHTAKLKRLPKVLPELYEQIHCGPRWLQMSRAERRHCVRKEPPSFQAADVMFGVVQPSHLNGNQPGLGKTKEVIAQIFEAGTDDGPQLVIAPVSALETTWQAELERSQMHPVYVATGTKKQKQDVIDSFVREIVETGLAGWLVTNQDPFRFREEFDPCDVHMLEPQNSAKTKRAMRKCYTCDVSLRSEFPVLHEIEWSNICADEVHKRMLRNPASLTAQGLQAIRLRDGGGKRDLSGTPMGGKIINLWSILHHLHPRIFSSKWRWAEQWTDVTVTKVRGRGGKMITKRDIGSCIRHCDEHRGHDDDGPDGRPDCAGCRAMEDAFYNMLSPYVIRRTKAEALPWLPPKHHIDVWCDFGSTKHAKQYEEFAEDSETIINDEEISATSVLDEYTRLKQFSFARFEIKNDRLVPTTDSGKLAAMQADLESLGIWNGETDEQVVIFSQFSLVVDLVHKWLVDNGIRAAKITGGVNKKGQRRQIQDDFQTGGRLQALVMTTTAGGVSINLDRASNVFILDETWDPDDQEQAEDRCHRGSRLHQVTIRYYRTRGTIEEYIQSVTWKKSATNVRVLDLRRLRLRKQAPVRRKHSTPRTRGSKSRVPSAAGRR